jgi:LysR family transcriptional regulator, transcriptional activator of the cysJI operon
MTMDRFRVFAAAARYGNVTRASEELYITQPAVTKQLKTLERDYNANLYKRNGRGIELTEVGQVFLRKVKNLLKNYDSLIQISRANGSAAKVDALLTIGGTYSPSTSLLPSLMARFKESHPAAALSLRTDNKVVIEGLVLNGVVDMALLLLPEALPNRRLAIEPICVESLVAFVHPRHPLAKKPRITFKDLARCGFAIRKRVSGTGATGQYIQDMRKQGVDLKVVMRCDTPEGVKEVVRNKLGVGLLFRGSVEDNIKRGEFKAIKLPADPIEGTYYLVYHKTRPLSPLAQDFLTLLRQQRDPSIDSQIRR